MHFFKSLATIATVALSAVSVIAAPAFVHESADVHVKVLRDDAPSSLPIILTTVTTTITPLAQKLETITVENCTVEVVGSVVADIKTALSDAITEVNALAGSPLTTVLTTVDGVEATVTELAGLISGLLHLVLSALGAVLTIAKNLNVTEVVSLLAGVGGLLGSLVTAVLALVAPILAGLLATLVPLLDDVLAIISSLGITTLISALGLPL